MHKEKRVQVPEDNSRAMTDTRLEAAARNAAQLAPDERTQARLDRRAAEALKDLGKTVFGKGAKPQTKNNP